MLLFFQINANWSDSQPYCTQILGDLGYVEQLDLILGPFPIQLEISSIY